LRRRLGRSRAEAGPLAEQVVCLGLDLFQMNGLLRLLWNEPPVVSNPLEERMRAEVLEILKRNDVSALLQATNSCAATRGLPNETPHCGVCSQCVDRRFASLAAGLADHDRARHYAKDLFRDAPPEGKPRQ
jgi:hypothetical protein